MGCANTKSPPSGVWERKRHSNNTIASLEADQSLPGKIQKRFGHPSSDKEHGYDFGLRVRVKGNKISIYVASSKSDGTKVTIKECHLHNYPEKHTVDETYLLSELAHECLPVMRSIYITDISLFMVVDYMDPGRLKNFLDLKNRHSSLSFDDSKQIVSSLASLLVYCHDKKIILRNLTPDNIMLRKNGDHYEVKVVDLSYAVPIGCAESLSDHPLFDWADVPYTAPEALVGHSYSTPMDCWSLGVLFYVMLTGILPFYHEDDRTLVHTIKTAAYSFDINSPVSTKGRQFIGSLLRAEPGERMTAKDIVREKWLQESS